MERKELFADMLVSPVMHIDCTNAYVFVCASPDGKAIYSAREKKRHEGVYGTVARDYQGILSALTRYSAISRISSASSIQAGYFKSL